MQLHTNEDLLRRQLRISLIYLFASLAFLVGGFLLSLSLPDPVAQSLVSMPALLIGILLWARNQAYLIRWGPRSRQDRVLSRSLRGLDHRYHFFAFPNLSLPDYVIVGPMGMVVLIPRAVAGSVTCYGDQWSHDEGRPLLARLLLWFTYRPTLRNPTADAQRGIQATYRYLDRRLTPEVRAGVRVDALVVLTHPQVKLTQHGCPVPTLMLRSLRDHVRRLPKALTPGDLDQLLDALPPD